MQSFLGFLPTSASLQTAFADGKTDHPKPHIAASIGTKVSGGNSMQDL